MCTLLKGLVFLITVYRMVSAFIEVIPITKQLMTFVKTLILKYLNWSAYVSVLFIELINRIHAPGAVYKTPSKRYWSTHLIRTSAHYFSTRVSGKSTGTQVFFLSTDQHSIENVNYLLNAMFTTVKHNVKILKIKANSYVWDTKNIIWNINHTSILNFLKMTLATVAGARRPYLPIGPWEMRL